MNISQCFNFPSIHIKGVTLAVAAMLGIVSVQAQATTVSASKRTAHAKVSTAAKALVLARSNLGPVVTNEDVVSELSTKSEAERQAFWSKFGNLEQLIEQTMTRRKLAAEGLKAGVNKDQETATALAIARERILAFAYLAKVDKQNVANEAKLEADAAALYNENPGRYIKPPRSHVRHILLSKDEPDSVGKAQALYEQLQQGASFETLAKAHSVDKKNAGVGGDLGFLQRGFLPQALDEAVLALEPGQITKPIETQFGYHIAKLEERRGEGIAPYDEVRQQVTQEVKANTVRQGRIRLLDEIKDSITQDKLAIESFMQSQTR